MSRLAAIAATIAAVTTLVACGTDSDSAGASVGGFPVTVQSCDRTLTIERPPSRVLTQGPEAEILVAAAGAANRIVARDSDPTDPHGRYEQALHGIPRIGDGHNQLSREAVVAQNPDLVVNRGAGNDLPPDALGAGIQTYVVSGRCTQNQTGIVADGSFDQIYSELGTFGRIFGTQGIATSAVADLRNRVAAVREQATSLPPGRTAAAINVAGGAIYGYGNKATVQSQMSALGLRNVFADQDRRYFETSAEQYLNRDPDVLIVLTEQATLDEKTIAALPALANLRAIREGRILSIPFGLSVASPLAVDGLESLATQLRQKSS